MRTSEEDEEFIWREIPPPLSLKPPEEVERETCERRRGRDLLLAIDHGHNSKHAFDWTLAHFCRMADTLHLVHAVSNVRNEAVCQATQVLMENLAAEAFNVVKVKIVARIGEGDAGKVICREAERLRPAAVIMGTRGRGLFQSVLQGSVSEYCLHHCKVAPIIIVPGKESGERSII
uniref:UspA domain-containing protein n=1 Tax=Opuntia streptacantha TaxID=393608 RepID=A0A7C8YN52_OPUST